MDEETLLYLAEYVGSHELKSIYLLRDFHGRSGEEHEAVGAEKTETVIGDMNDEEEHEAKISMYSLKREKKKRTNVMQEEHWNEIKEEDDNCFEMEFNEEIDLEEYLVMRAITDTSCPKLLDDDMRAFKAITRDVFPKSRD